jgi:hypothetical protein
MSTPRKRSDNPRLVARPKRSAPRVPRVSGERKLRLIFRPPPRKIGRPATGKRSNPEYRQVSMWMRRDTHDAAVHRLGKEGREFSVLVQELIEDWLRYTR